MSHPINDQILENIYEEIQENYPNLSEKDQQQLAYKTMEDLSQWATITRFGLSLGVITGWK